MNQYDTDLVRSILTQENFSLVPSIDEADVVMLNTCSVRENANNKIYNRVHEIKRQKNNNVLIGVLGCMATNFKTQLLENRRFKIDFIAGPDSYKQLPQLIRATSETGKKSFDVTLSEFETYSDVMPVQKSGVNAWVAVMRGCNNYCTFCVVPLTRGRERSRDPHNVVEEVKNLVHSGFSQVTLLGQNVNSYHYENHDFADLVAMVSDVEGIKRIRFTSPHPKDFPRKLLHVMAQRPNVCKQVHMPLQAGNTRVLHKMNRTYSKEEYLGLIDEVKAVMPKANITSDIIVGFPSETEEEFEDTLDVVQKVRFDSAFIFKYSERPGTTAARKFPDDVSEEAKKARIIKLNEIQKQISLEKNREHIGAIQSILVEDETKKQDGIQGRNDGNTIVVVPKGPYQTGAWLNVKITDATINVLKGVPV